MTRILADLPDDDIKWLDQLASEQGKSRASMIREAVASYKAESETAKGKAWLDRAFGIWKGRGDIGDSIEWQRRERASGTRPWDDDYDDVKAEFPDLFDDHDDRERDRYLKMTSGKTPDEKPAKR